MDTAHSGDRGDRARRDHDLANGVVQRVGDVEIAGAVGGDAARRRELRLRTGAVALPLDHRRAGEDRRALVEQIDRDDDVQRVRHVDVIVLERDGGPVEAGGEGHRGHDTASRVDAPELSAHGLCDEDAAHVVQRQSCRMVEARGGARAVGSSRLSCDSGQRRDLARRRDHLANDVVVRVRHVDDPGSGRDSLRLVEARDPADTVRAPHRVRAGEGADLAARERHLPNQVIPAVRDIEAFVAVDGEPARIGEARSRARSVDQPLRGASEGGQRAGRRVHAKNGVALTFWSHHLARGRHEQARSVDGDPDRREVAGGKQRGDGAVRERQLSDAPVQAVDDVEVLAGVIEGDRAGLLEACVRADAIGIAALTCGPCERGHDERGQIDAPDRVVVGVSDVEASSRAIEREAFRLLKTRSGYHAVGSAARPERARDRRDRRRGDVDLTDDVILPCPRRRRWWRWRRRRSGC